MPRPHPPEFRRRAIELGRERAKPIGQIAADLGIAPNTAVTWAVLAPRDWATYTA